MDFADIEKGIGEYAKKARDGKLALEDLQGGTFTITNGGTFGSLLSTPIVNPPQSAILGMHTIKAVSYTHLDVYKRQAVVFVANLAYDFRQQFKKDVVCLLYTSRCV